jgi:hypothetical protein
VVVDIDVACWVNVCVIVAVAAKKFVDVSVWNEVDTTVCVACWVEVWVIVA